MNHQPQTNLPTNDDNSILISQGAEGVIYMLINIYSLENISFDIYG